MGKLSTGAGNLVRQTEELRKLGAKTNKAIAKDIVSLADAESDDLLPEATD